MSNKKVVEKYLEGFNASDHTKTITTIRLVEEGNIVVAEGAVKSKMKTGALLDAVFCDVFHFENNRIKQLTTYLMHRKQQ